LFRSRLCNPVEPVNGDKGMNCSEKNSAQISKRATGERGATMVEYAIMVALIAVAVIAAVRLIGTNVSAQFNEVANQVN